MVWVTVIFAQHSKHSTSHLYYGNYWYIKLFPVPCKTQDDATISQVMQYKVLRYITQEYPKS